MNAPFDDEEDQDAPLPPVPDDWTDQLLRFWFDNHGEADWFGGDADFDAAVAERFDGWRTTLRAQPVDAFVVGAATALAGVILFDQVPRNAHRGTAEAFATDEHALAIAREAVARGYDQPLEPAQRLFLYLPFEHSEDMDDQREAVRLVAAIGDAGWLDYAQRHLAVIERFGRFPHRNRALGRPDRPGEAEAVAAGMAF